MKCSNCGSKMDKVEGDCSCGGGCCGIADKPYWVCPKCGRIEEIR